MKNHLKDELSTYLQQHSNHPVKWYPWGDAAFSKALKEHKPIFLSIGYSSCRQCQIMEDESLKDEKSVKILNRDFVCIKVDREERPDIDNYFQKVYQLMNRNHGGWPTSIFLTEERKPFYAAAYIPPEPNYNMMGFCSLLEIITDKYKNDKKLLTQKADEILRFLNPKVTKIEATKLDMSIFSRIGKHAQELFESEYGGFSKAPKFPQTSTLSLLLDLYKLTGDKKSLNLVSFTLDAMAKGGLRDLIDGGFFRYTIDNNWQIPYFAKMTYDNAMLSEIYLKAYHVTRNHFYKEVAFETLDFMLDKMSKEHLFYTALDANYQDEKGRYFLYSYDKVIKSFEKAGIPAKEYENLTKALHITKAGNFEGKNIIHIDNPQHPNIPYLQEAIEALAIHREEHPYPFIDKKIIVSWNAMMIKSLFKAARVEKRYLQAAIKSLDALLDTMYIHAELYHSTLSGKPPKIKAFLEDYAYLADTLIEAYESTLNEIYLVTAHKLTNSAIEQYYDRGKWRFSQTEFGVDADIHDTAYPSSVATILSVLYSISSLIDNIYKKFVFKTLEIYSYELMRQPLTAPKMSQMVLRYLKDDIIIKAHKEKLKPHIQELDTLPHPFSLFKHDTNDGFMLCNSHACFGHEKNFAGILEVLEKRE